MRQETLNHRKMETKKTKPQSFLKRLLECKLAIRECIQNGADPEEMKRIADDYGFKFATPV